MQLSDQAQRFLQLINDHGGQWLSRSDIAQLAGKKRLNPYEIGVIDLLVERGLIQRRSEAMGGAIGFQWQYQALSNQQ